MTHADRVIRTVSDLRDLIHRLKAAPTRPLTDEERSWGSTQVVNEDPPKATVPKNCDEPHS
jgi:hypothetical protein